MSETQYERNGDKEWHKIASFPESAGMLRRLPISPEIEQALEFAYQLGLQSHPAPTPDLLLTDEQNEAIAQAFWHKYSGKGLSANEVMDLHHSEFFEEFNKAQLAHCEPLIRADERAKLQQARPTTEAREKIAKSYFEFDIRRWHKQGSTGLPTWEFIKERPLDSKPYYDVANQILRLLPDEQGIRESERKVIGEWLDGHMEYPITPEVGGYIASLKAGEPPQGCVK